jgi:hypothetical protein
MSGRCSQLLNCIRNVFLAVQASKRQSMVSVGMSAV